MFKITDNRKMKLLEAEGNHNRNMSQEIGRAHV